MVNDDLSTAPTYNDQDWLALLKAMNERAWDDLLRHFGDDLQRDIRASVNKFRLPLDVADDVEQETWRTAIQKIDEFHAEEIVKLYHWLRVIAYNKVRMLHRKRHWESFDEMDTDDTGVSLDWFLYTNDLAGKGPEGDVLSKERMKALESALREMLTPRDREIFLRRVVNGETPRHLAEVYNLEARSISQILYRAKQTLGRHLAAIELFRRED